MPRTPSFFSSILVLGLLVLCAIMYLRLNADSISTRIVAAKLNESLRGSALSSNVGHVIFKPGKGLEISGLRLVHRDSGRELLHVDRVVVAMPTGAEDLAQFDFRPELVEVHRATLRLDYADLPQLPTLLAGVKWNRDSAAAVAVRVRDSRLVLLDGRQSITNLSQVAFDVTPSSSDDHYHIQGYGTGQHLDQVSFSANVDPTSKQFEILSLQAEGSFDRSLLHAIPVDLRLQGRPMVGEDTNFGGSWKIAGVLSGNCGDLANSKFAINLSLDDVNLVNDRLPAVLKNCSCQARITDHSVNIKRAHGQLDDGQFSLNYKQSGLIQRRDWRLSGSCNELTFSRKWLAFFPDSIRKFCRDYEPAGLFDVQFSLDSSGNKQITSQLKDTSFSYNRFPYRLRHCIGDVRWIGDRLRYEVKTLENGQLLEIGGHIDNPGKNATYVCNFGTDGRLPIDEPLLQSLVNYPAIDRAVRDFRPLGRVSGRGTIEKLTAGPQAKVQKRLTIRLHDCDVRHRSFDYPIQQVNGTIHVDNDRFRFEDVTGNSSAGGVECNGDWNAKDGLNLAFLCSGVPFDDRLRHALEPQLQSVWDNLRPTGQIRLGKVFLNYLPETGAPDIRVQASFGGSHSGRRSSSVSITPSWFPYQITDLTGDIEVGGGLITMSNIRGKHGGTWMTCAGEGSYDQQQWSVRLYNLLAGSVALEHDLMNALPEDLATCIGNLQFEGHFHVGGEISFSSRCGEITTPEHVASQPIQAVSYEDVPTDTSIEWNLRFDMDQARMVVGLPVDNIFGSLYLRGSYNGKTASTAGRIAFDSATIHGAQITNIAGPIWIDNKQTLAGTFAENEGQPPASITGTAFAGTVQFDGWVSHEDSLPFFVQATVEDSQLEDAAAEIAPHLEEMSGDAFGFIRLRGNAEKLHTFKGVGNIHLRNARIHQLPVILALLKILQVKEVNRTAFDSSDVDFTINGDQIELSRIELIGDAISLIGNGYLEWMRYADVNFYSVLGRNRFHIPLLSDLYKAGCQRTLWINIGGPMDRLQTSRKVLPGLNDSIKALFQSSRTANSSPNSNTVHR